MDPLLEIRKLPPSVTTRLRSLLDYRNQWKDLMAIIPKKLSTQCFVSSISDVNPVKYSQEDIEIIDQAARQYNMSPTVILFDEWGTSGRPRANLRHLLHLLAKANLYRAADYVSVELLKESPISRPKTGPASTIILLPDDLSPQEKTELDIEHMPLPNEVKDLLKQVQNLHINQNEIAVSLELLTKPELKSLESLLNQLHCPFSQFEKGVIRSDITTSCIRSLNEVYGNRNINKHLEASSVKGTKSSDVTLPNLSMLLTTATTIKVADSEDE